MPIPPILLSNYVKNAIIHLRFFPVSKCGVGDPFVFPRVRFAFSLLCLPWFCLRNREPASAVRLWYWVRICSPSKSVLGTRPVTPPINFSGRWPRAWHSESTHVFRPCHLGPHRSSLAAESAFGSDMLLLSGLTVPLQIPIGSHVMGFSARFGRTISPCEPRPQGVGKLYCQVHCLVCLAHIVNMPLLCFKH